MSFPITPSKRPYDRNPLELNGRAKWQKTAAFNPQLQPLKIPPGSTAFRVLCPALKSGSVIGKGGTVVNKIRKETGAKIRIEETIPGCAERIIVIVGSDKDAETSNDQKKSDDESDDIANDSDDAGEQDESKDDKEVAPIESPQSEKASSSAQKALLRVFERMVEVDPEVDGEDEASKKSSAVYVRLLVLSSQVGCILGKGGSVIKHISAESGAQIRILPRDKLPSCASPFDELVQITGGLDAVRKALQLVSQQLLENPPRDRDSFPASKTAGPSSHPFTPLPQPEIYPPAIHHFPVQGAPYAVRPHSSSDFHPSITPSIPKFHETESVILGRMRTSQEILTFRLLCMDDKIGGVIGKGGSIIKALQHETGCDIKIPDAVADSDDRVIIISGPAHLDDRISAAQDAVLRVQSRVLRPVSDGKEKSMSSRLLVPSNQIGCLLGKGGAIIAEMRKASGAYIRILGKDQIPKCASENEEVVQINGEFEAVQEAVLQITSRLRHHQFRDKFPSMNHPPRSAFPDQGPPFVPYMGRRDLSPPGMYSNLGLPFHKFDGVGGLPHHDERSAFAHGIHRHGFPPHSSERLPSSVPWAAQGTRDGGGPIGISDYTGAPQRRMGGAGGGSQPSFITSTTVEVVVPRSLVASIYGEDGGCLKQIREISGAKITITDTAPGATETVIIISGTPEQTHAAQSLLQAFVMSGTASP
ncbi:RNA-binding KH domain-containing protein RCF3-like [Magnolia sinica]|uniref:RNA-binding KH domain-containing protein RCF3-like n=1 Tax=Magnolia sinica TaxID=86752 RepID=UPI0026584FCF|nr:RNA-binding KH domain-containing protein RCF3-like [Magnolia sinica]XP_058081788.1 RNA-binding KH domain-containing protein RCF3-like [Magnolia sinica]